VLERVVPDLVARMREASVSVSQCGYNTAMDIVAAGVPALVVPFAADGEDEQTNRARRMQELGLLRMFEASSLDAPRFARAIEATLEFRPSVSALNLDGARCTARELYRLWSERHMPHSQTGTA
jgi:predicted glycosyltransferase